MKTNWAQILEELKDKGYTVYKVSLILQKRWDAVQGWKEGREPKHSDGERLLELHEAVCGIAENSNGN